MSGFTVFGGTGDYFIIASAGGVICGDESALIRHLRHIERDGGMEATVYVKRAEYAAMEEVTLKTEVAGEIGARFSDRFTEINTVSGVFVRLLAWQSPGKTREEATV